MGKLVTAWELIWIFAAFPSLPNPGRFMAFVGIWSRKGLSSNGLEMNLYLGNPVGMSGLSDDKSFLGGMVYKGNLERVEVFEKMELLFNRI